MIVTHNWIRQIYGGQTSFNMTSSQLLVNADSTSYINSTSWRWLNVAWFFIQRGLLSGLTFYVDSERLEELVAKSRIHGLYFYFFIKNNNFYNNTRITDWIVTELNLRMFDKHIRKNHLITIKIMCIFVISAARAVALRATGITNKSYSGYSLFIFTTQVHN